MSISMTPTTVVLSQQESLLPRLEATASNLANADTAGFKRLLSPTTEVVKVEPKTGSVSYVSLPSLVRDLDQGSLKKTGEKFDLAIAGKGYFMMEGGKYSRNGHFTIDAQGQVVNALGMALLDAGGSPLTIPSGVKDVDIAEDGIVSSGKTIIGQIGIVDFADPQKLQNEGNGIYTSAEEGIAAENTSVMQGYVEQSNVQTVVELINLIDIERLFQQGQNLLEAEMQRRKEEINVSATN